MIDQFNDNSNFGGLKQNTFDALNLLHTQPISLVEKSNP